MAGKAVADGGTPLQTGLVVAAHGRHVMVEAASQFEGHSGGVQRVLCHLRSKGRGTAGDLVVGDRVQWRTTGDGGVVEATEPRRNLLFRQDEWRSKSFAANLDLMLILVAPEPVFSESQLSRALIAAADAGIAALIGLNKTDLPTAPLARERLAPYRAMGIDVVELAARREPDATCAALQPWLDNRTTLILGPSGMGKSTLVNLLVPSAAAKSGINVASRAGSTWCKPNS